MADRRSIEMGRGHITIGADQGPLEQALNSAKAKFQAWGASVKAAGMAMLQTGAAMSLPLAGGVREFANYEQALANLQAASGLSAAGMGPVRAEIENVARATGESLVDVTASFSELIKAGRTVDEVIGGLGMSTVQFARVGMMPLAQASGVLLQSMNIFGGTADQVANTISQAADASQASIQSIADGIANVGPVARNTNMSIRDTATALGILTDRGQVGAEGGTALRNVLTRLSTGSDGATEALQALGVSTYGAGGQFRPLMDIIDDLTRATANMSEQERNTRLFQLAGAYGQVALKNLMAAGRTTWNSFQENMAGALTIEQKFAIMTDTLWGLLSKVWVHIQLVAVEIGSALAPALRVAGAVLLPLLNGLASFIKNNQNLVQMFAFDAAKAIAFGAALVGIGMAISFMGTLFGFAATAVAFFAGAIGLVFSPAVWIIAAGITAAVAGLAVALSAAGVRFGAMSESLGFVDDIIDRIVDGAKAIWDWLTDTSIAQFIGNVADTLGGIWDAVMKFADDSGLSAVIGEILRFAAGVVILAGGLAYMAGYLVYLGITAIEFRAIFASIASWFSGDGNFIARLAAATRDFLGLWRSIIGFVVGPIARIGDVVMSLGQTLSNIGSQIANSFGNAWERTATDFADMATNITGTANQASGAIRDAFAAGDWNLIWEIVKVSAMLTLNDIAFFAESTFNSWSDALLDTFDTIWTEVAILGQIAWAKIQAFVNPILVRMLQAIGIVMAGIPGMENMGERAEAMAGRLMAIPETAEQIRARIENEDPVAWFEAQRVRNERDEAFAGANVDEANRLQAELNGLTERAAFWADYTREMGGFGAAAPGAGRGPAAAAGGGGVGGAGSGSSMGTFSRYAAAGFLGAHGGVGETRAERLASEQLATQRAFLRELERLRGVVMR